MPLQNRVNPSGEILVSSERGTLMGNRGCLHDANRKIVATSKRTAWVACLLEFKGRKRPLMQPGQYTELFFLDEATALAAGHRPCAECQRPRYKKFLAAWPHGQEGKMPRACDVDLTLKYERGRQVRLTASSLHLLPTGTFVQDLETQEYYLLHAGSSYRWSFGGYGAPRPMSQFRENVALITPMSTLETFKNGYLPTVHPSVHGENFLG